MAYIPLIYADEWTRVFTLAAVGHFFRTVGLKHLTDEVTST